MVEPGSSPAIAARTCAVFVAPSRRCAPESRARGVPLLSGAASGRCRFDPIHAARGCTALELSFWALGLAGFLRLCESRRSFPADLRRGSTLGCIFVLIALLSPRLAVALMWIFTPWVDRAFGPNHLADPRSHRLSTDHAPLRHPLEHRRPGRDRLGVDLVILAFFGDVVSWGGGAFGRRRRAF
jgi:hypothetical protein